MKKYLIDTNIFLEILLTRSKEGVCASFLSNKIGNLNIFDFTLHSIGVFLFRNNKEDVFNKFMLDVENNMNILTLEKESYRNMSSIFYNYKLDFDGTYQTQIALDNNLEIVTLDKDFNKVNAIIEVNFL